MQLWRPKAKVTIVELDDDLFSFGFDNNRESAMVLKGGPWLYNGALLVMVKADTLAHPTQIALYTQEFWIQVKGLLLAYMTRHMGQFIGNQIGEHVLIDQSRKGDVQGTILRIRVVIDITKPLRRSLLFSIKGSMVSIDLRYEKVPITCFLCGLIGHIEDQCEQYKGKNDDDLSKPYGRWFQNDVLDANYRRPQGICIGPSPSSGWSMDVEEEKDDVSIVGQLLGTVTESKVASRIEVSVGDDQGMKREIRSLNGAFILPDLNVVMELEDMIIDSQAIVPF
ncbi:uncharacterized protein [Pyrus communis]|uniref:uncharacterized protein n=1 Tax=Pyrus communis TaxID=23211 RepID=UPI0035C127AE